MHICAVVAAAGLSSRMGSFKPLLPIDGQPAVIRLLHTLHAAGVSQTILVTGFRHVDLERACRCLPDVMLAYNPDFAHTQMFDSIRLGLTAVPHICSRILFIPADVPLVSQKTVHSLAHTTAPLAYPSYLRRCGHPISLNAALLPSLLHYNGSNGLRGALRSLPVEPVYYTVDDPFIRMDMDTPADYHALLRRKQAFLKENHYAAQDQHVELS
nr:nucleotidyltransferase family protein [uncultured Agathobaculum sp.]